MVMMLDVLRHALSDDCGCPRGSRLVVAVSGGPDSVALLLGLRALAPDLDLALHVAHLDHGLRPDSADDAAFVADLASRFGLSISVERADVLAVARRRRRGLEDAARTARYDFLARVADGTGADAVTVGHTADDQAETILLHVIRGAGLAGLRGMSPTATFDLGAGRSLRVVRPLLGASRAQTVAYCRENGVAPRHDVTNDSPDILRNRVRGEVLPLLRSLNPRIGEALARLGEAAGADSDLLEGLASEAWNSVARDVGQGRGVAIDRAAYAAAAPAIRLRLIRRAFDRVAGTTDGLAARHGAAADALLATGSAGQSLDLPAGVRVVLAYGEGLFEAEPLPSLPDSPVRLTVPGVTALPEIGMRIVAEVRDRPCPWSRADRFHADLDLDLCGPDPIVRRRRAGDRLVPLGTTGSRKLQDVLVDAKVPRERRDGVSLVARGDGGNEVAWVVGVRLDNRFRVSDDTRRILCLRAEEQG